jgi:hypothetical protein
MLAPARIMMCFELAETRRAPASPGATRNPGLTAD